MSFHAISAQLEFLAWRDAQLAAISLQLEEAFPALCDELNKLAEHARLVALVRSTLDLRSSAEATIQQWAASQLEMALSRAEADLDETLTQMPGSLDLDRDLWAQVYMASPAIAGVSLIGLSVAAIPTVVSFATVSTSLLAFWGTAAISWPLLALGATGIGVATLMGSRSLKFAENKARAALGERLRREADRRVFGIGEKPGARCILSDIQAAVFRAGQNRIAGSV